jgi:hypothetical protein
MGGSVTAVDSRLARDLGMASEATGRYTPPMRDGQIEHDHFKLVCIRHDGSQLVPFHQLTWDEAVEIRDAVRASGEFASVTIVPQDGESGHGAE